MKKIFDILAAIMGVILLLSIGAMDSEALWIPVTAFLVSGGYLTAYAYAKGWMYGSVE